MDDIEQKALALLNAVEKDMGLYRSKALSPDSPAEVALRRAIEQHEAFRQKVSDAVEQAQTEDWDVHPILWRFLIPKPKPDPLVEVLKEVTWYDNEITAKELRAALKARGLTITTLEKD